MIKTCDALSFIKENVCNELKKGGSGFSDIFSLLSKGEGKYLRSRLGLACSCDQNGLVAEAVIQRLSAVELLHLATLVHDDVIDDSKERRGLPSVQAAFGKRGAVIAGDYLLTRCFSLLSDESNQRLKLFAKTVSAVCRGEMLQERSLFDRTVTPVHYIKTVSGKTAALFSAAAASGKNDFAHISIGHKFGIVYQIYDDIRDFTGVSKNFCGKPFSKDLKSGVITLPAIFCLNRNPNYTDEQILDDIVYGTERSREVATRYFNKLQKLIERAGVLNPKEINEILNKVMQ